MSSIRVGDTVMVPGDMHGTVKFIGPVAGKRGTFAGVQLATEYAPRGKNSGDVDGKYYFKTTIPGAGIFLPLEKAIKKPGSSGSGLGLRASPGPGTPTRLSSFNQGGRTPGLAKPNFSQSVGPGMRAGAASPALKPPARRESLPRPASPLRKVNTPTPKTLATPKTRPSGIGLGKSTNGAVGQFSRPGPRTTNNFSQSLRQSTSTPNYPGTSPSLGPESSFDEIPEQDADSTPTPTPFASRVGDADAAQYEGKIRNLTDELNEAKRQLRDQHANFTEMEHNFNELQKLIAGLEEGASRRGSSVDDIDLPRDVASLRDVLREKNDRIKLLTAEFDANRADFRSTIDTLEMASTETERVYEKRVDELLEEVRNLQDRSEDVETVAQQLKQLEELVQELEEGLEDARRGEAEARGEVEFLRGEVERSRSELRRERERIKTEEQLNGYPSSGFGNPERESQLSAKDDEIRGLKAIIQSLNETHNTSPKMNGNSFKNNDSSTTASNTNSTDGNRFSMQEQIRDLEALLQQKSLHEEELANEVKQLRNSVAMSRFPLPGAAFGIRTAMSPGGHSRESSEDLARKHLSAGSQRTVVLGSPKAKGQRSSHQDTWHDAQSRGASPVKPLTAHHEYSLDSNLERARSEDGVTDISASSAALWCEICEEGGHDILTCSNMFGPGKPKSKTSSLGRNAGKDVLKGIQRHSADSAPADTDRPAPLMSRKSNNSVPTTSSLSPSSAPSTSLPPPPVSSTSAASSSTAKDVESPAPPPPPKSDPSPPLMDNASLRGPAAPPAVNAGPIEGIGDQAGMMAGKTSGVIDPEKWCALCERDGHDSVDCPVEDSF
ncbi:uncharacterized protein A1O9_04105 [Exophiala aquamarina CBS 119918]|uniref:CAP-Gly domain-containing protein n=1 Tax=Exophiala aquamarina CBS 119918 TaxID=1182545 RepID=A0A072PHG5_9EURO|nr:uncharacterized protein A1O9_04105 [Exophiala aquamarina CBS 119918]KEF59261.1 hypothetical protein A1O9_04105 [Exophiala aquamarina CBS 119918]